METPAVPNPVAVPTGNDKIWSILCHLSFFLGVGFLLPLVVYLAMRRESVFAGENAREALNFHISVILYCILCIPLTFVFIGIPLMIAIIVTAIGFAIIAAVKTSNGEIYRYPLTIRLVP